MNASCLHLDVDAQCTRAAYGTAVGTQAAMLAQSHRCRYLIGLQAVDAGQAMAASTD